VADPIKGFSHGITNTKDHGYAPRLSQHKPAETGNEDGRKRIDGMRSSGFIDKNDRP
jgi:hypothetical protein